MDYCCAFYPFIIEDLLINIFGLSMVYVISPLPCSNHVSRYTCIVSWWVLVTSAVHWWWKSVTAIPDKNTDQSDVELACIGFVVVWWEDQIDLILF